MENLITIYDVTDKSAPIPAGEYRDLGHTPPVRSICDFVLSGDYAYLIGADESGGLRVIDVSNPAQPDMVTYSNITVGEILKIQGDYAFIGAGHTLKVVDISNIYSPVLVGAYDAPSSITDLDIRDNYIFATTSKAGVYIFHFEP